MGHDKEYKKQMKMIKKIRDRDRKYTQKLIEKAFSEDYVSESNNTNTPINDKIYDLDEVKR